MDRENSDRSAVPTSDEPCICRRWEVNERAVDTKAGFEESRARISRMSPRSATSRQSEQPVQRSS